MQTLQIVEDSNTLTLSNLPAQKCKLKAKPITLVTYRTVKKTAIFFLSFTYTNVAEKKGKIDGPNSGHYHILNIFESKSSI